jgi:two-component system, cell cycle response regulator
VPRLTRSLFRDLALYMMGFGLVVGVAFPPLVVAVGIVDADRAYTVAFWCITVSAGLVVGAVNIVLARWVVGARMRVLSDSMKHVTDRLAGSSFSDAASSLDPTALRIPFASADTIGEAAEAFDRLSDTLAKSQAVERAVSEFNRTITASLEVDRLAGESLAQLVRVGGASAGALFLAEHGELRVQATVNRLPVARIAACAPVRRVLDGETAVQFRLPVRESRRHGDVACHEILAQPIRLGEEALGILTLVRDDLFAPEAVSLVAVLTQTLAVALNNAATRAQLERAAILDELTGCFNRGFGQRRCQEEFARAVQSGMSLGALMLDIDRFKQVNDTFGHFVGDRVLCRVAQVARDHLREGDVFVRLGGEEFLALLPGASRAQAIDVAERIRAAVEHSDVHEGAAVVGVSVSVGVSAYPDNDAATAADMLCLADDALYAAKRQGRNRVVGSTALGPAPAPETDVAPATIAS